MFQKALQLGIDPLFHFAGHLHGMIEFLGRGVGVL